jgi:hypothetical protein
LGEERGGFIHKRVSPVTRVRNKVTKLQKEKRLSGKRKRDFRELRRERETPGITDCQLRTRGEMVKG